jgi:site-specific DNA recombinase
VGEQETELLSVPVRLRRAGREIRIVMDGTDPFATAKPDVRLVKLLLTARRFNAVLTRAKTPPHSPSERASVGPTSRLVRLSYIALDITQAILDGRQPRDLTPEKLLEHSRLPLAWHAQRIALGFG